MTARNSRHNYQRGNGEVPRRQARVRARRVAPGATTLGREEVKHLLRAPGGYADIARQFAHALEQTGFRGPISPPKIRSLLARGERLVQSAAVARVKASATDQQRMLHDSQVWKSILSTWRLIVAAMPDRPELQGPFAFMQAYMAPSRKSAPEPAPAPAPAPPAAIPSPLVR